MVTTPPSEAKCETCGGTRKVFEYVEGTAVAESACPFCAALPEQVTREQIIEWLRGEFHVRSDDIPTFNHDCRMRDAALKFVGGWFRTFNEDELGVDRFAAAMKAKLSQKSLEGRGGWDDPAQCTVESLAQMLIEHLPKGDTVDIGNFAMMLWNRLSGDRALAAAASHLRSAPLALTEALRFVDFDKAAREWIEESGVMLEWSAVKRAFKAGADMVADRVAAKGVSK